MLRIRKELLNNPERVEYVQCLDKLSEKHPEWDVELWWKNFSGMELGNGEYRYKDMAYYMLPLVKEDDKGKKVVSGEKNYTVNLVTGEEVNEDIQSGDFKRFNIQPIEYDESKEYCYAGLFLYSSYPHYSSYSVLDNDYESVCQGMEDYREKLDQKERSRNMWFDSGFFESNADKHKRRRMESGNPYYDWHDEVNDWFWRQQKEDKYRSSLENSRTTIRYISSYTYELYFVGVFVWANADELSDILIFKDGMLHSRYETSGEEFINIIREYELESKYKNLPMPTIDVISKLDGFNLGYMDYTAKRPQDLTKEEWAAWIYAHVTE